MYPVTPTSSASHLLIAVRDAETPTSNCERARYILRKDRIQHSQDEGRDDGDQDSNGDARELPALDELDPEVGARGEDLHELVPALQDFGVVQEIPEAHVLGGAHRRGAEAAGVDARVVCLEVEELSEGACDRQRRSGVLT